MNQFTNFDSKDTQKIEFTNDVAPNPPIETAIKTPLETPKTFQEQRLDDEVMMKIKEVLNPNEKILWTGRPIYRLYLLSNSRKLLITITAVLTSLYFLYLVQTGSNLIDSSFVKYFF
jgi:hypothetical protein